VLGVVDWLERADRGGADGRDVASACTDVLLTGMAA
jgi:hypothetical protein